MKKYFIASLIFVSLLFCVSCDATSIMKLGNRMSKLGKPVYYTNIPDDDLNKVFATLDYLIDPPEEEDLYNERRELIDCIQRIKKSPAQVKKLNSMLGVNTVMEDSKVKYYADEADGLRYICDVALHPEEKIPKLMDDFLTPFVESLSTYLAEGDDAEIESLLASLSEIFGMEVDEDTALILIILGPMIIEELVEEKIMENVVPKIKPYHDLITEIKASQELIYNELKKESMNRRLLACSVINDILASDMMRLAICLIPQETEVEGVTAIDMKSLLEVAGEVVSDLDSLSVIDPRISFESMNSLLSKINIGGAKK